MVAHSLKKSAGSQFFLKKVLVVHSLKKNNGCSSKLIVLKIADTLVADTLVLWIRESFECIVRLNLL